MNLYIIHEYVNVNINMNLYIIHEYVNVNVNMNLYIIHECLNANPQGRSNYFLIIKLRNFEVFLSFLEIISRNFAVKFEEKSLRSEFFLKICKQAEGASINKKESLTIFIS